MRFARRNPLGQGKLMRMILDDMDLGLNLGSKSDCQQVNGKDFLDTDDAEDTDRKKYRCES
jgi:hypothetical protein